MKRDQLGEEQQDLPPPIHSDICKLKSMFSWYRLAVMIVSDPCIQLPGPRIYVSRSDPNTGRVKLRTAF